MSVAWKINGTNFAQYPGAKPVLKYVNQRPDSLHWEVTEDFDGALDFALDAAVRLTRTPKLVTVAVTALVAGKNYQILTVGTTNFVAIGASSNTVGLAFTATGAGAGTGTVVQIPAGMSLAFTLASSINHDDLCEIFFVGTTDFTAIGAPDNNLGTQFFATGAGSGSGLVQRPTVWFSGNIRETPRAGSARSQSIGYTALGPWQWLERQDYLQKWRYADAPTMPISAAALATGLTYEITSVGMTDFTAIGASANRIGVQFTATGHDTSSAPGHIFGAAMLIKTYERGRVILGQHTDGTKRTPDIFITDILNFALSKEPGIFQIGTIDTAISTMRYEEALNLNCADAIQKCLQYCPDAVAFFDYSPAESNQPPRLNILRRGSMDSLTFDVVDDDTTNETAGAVRNLIELRNRPDLRRDSVALIYLSSNQANDYAWETPSYDLAGTGVTASLIQAGQIVKIVTLGTTDYRTIGAPSNTVGLIFTATGPGTGTGTATAVTLGGASTLTRTFELAGTVAHQAWLTQQITTVAISSSLVFSSPVASGGTFSTLLAFWQRHRPDFMAANITVTRFYRGTRTKDDGSAFNTACINEVTRGAITDWMQSQCGVISEKQIITADIEYQITVGGKTETHAMQLSAHITATNSSSQTYKKLSESDFTPGEVMPTGIAQMVLDGISAMQWDGQFVLIQADPSINYLCGRFVNLGGSLTDWATMNALIQSTEIELFEGRTKIVVGPPRQISPDDLVELFRPVPAVPAVMNLSTRTSGISGPAQIGLGLSQDHPSPPGSPGVARVAQKFYGAISTAGIVWAGSEVATAIQANYAAATGDDQYPKTNDQHFLSHGGATRLLFIVTGTNPGLSDRFNVSFVVNSTTYYAVGHQVGIWA